MSKFQDGEEALPYNKFEGKALYRILDNEEGRPTVVAHVASQVGVSTSSLQSVLSSLSV